MLRDLLLAAFAGFLGGILLLRWRHLPRSERPVARLLGALLEPIYYWTDSYGPDGRPSHSKVAYLMGLVTVLAILIIFALHEREHGQGAGDHDVGWGFIAFTAMVLAYALGKQVFNALIVFLAGRFPGMQHPRVSGSHTPPAPPPGREL